MFWVIVIFSLHFTVRSIRVGQIDDYVLVGFSNRSIANLTQNQCICQMMALSGSVVALNYFPMNQTCQLFVRSNNLLVIQNDSNSFLIFMNRTSISITTMQTDGTCHPNCPISGKTLLWSFNNTLNDASGQYIGSSQQSPTYTTGIDGYGSALMLDGTVGRCVTVTPFLNMSYASFTWEMWVYPTITPIGDRIFIGQCGQMAADQCLHILARSDLMYFGFYANDVTGSTLIPANQWSHLAFVYDMSARKKFIYRNGTLENIQTSADVFRGIPANMTFGCLIDGAGVLRYECFTGYIDQIAYTNRSKNASEILDDATLTAFFRFLLDAPLADSGPNYINANWGGGTSSITSGIVNQAITFTYTGAYFQLTGLVLLGNSDWPLSLSLWFKIYSLNGDATIAHLSDATFGAGWYTELIGLAADGTIHIRNNAGNVVLIGPVVPNGVWCHVVYTFSTTNGMRLYINGSLSNSIMTTYAASGTANTLTFGSQFFRAADGSVFLNQQFYGSIDEVRLYSRELSASDILQLYTTP